MATLSPSWTRPFLSMVTSFMRCSCLMVDATCSLLISPDISPVRAGRLERDPDILEYLRALRVEIAGANDIALGVGRQHAGNEQIFRCGLHARHVRILPERRAKLLDVVDFQF